MLPIHQRKGVRARPRSMRSASFSSQFDSGDWTGEVSASELSFDTNNNPVLTKRWDFSAVLATQTYDNRRIATLNSQTGVGVPFRLASLATAQQTALNPSFTTASDAQNYLNYLMHVKWNLGSEYGGNAAHKRLDRALFCLGAHVLWWRALSRTGRRSAERVRVSALLRPGLAVLLSAGNE